MVDINNVILTYSHVYSKNCDC